MPPEPNFPVVGVIAAAGRATRLAPLPCAGSASAARNSASGTAYRRAM